MTRWLRLPFDPPEDPTLAEGVAATLLALGFLLGAMALGCAVTGQGA